MYSISGILIGKGEHFFVVDTGAIAFQLFAPRGVLEHLPPIGQKVKIFSYLHVREDALQLYGFLSEGERDFFERLNTVSGVGPKSALGIMGVAPVEQLVAAVNEGRTELLTRASGVGRKTAERVILELKGKLTMPRSAETLSLMESDIELEETLMSLGFTRLQAKEVTGKIPASVKGFKERLKEALRKKE